eukprot:TRINITY_DN2298_c0_g1_i3.p2 TRINITY_DN2298_c0_g1~~TRINITY_DN2298_c0_g1_i3.p2  ORF type:complete len:133 (+),score=29.96 TRINITY_DN2298_c0_g1_i3:51-401(+)
MGLLKMKRSVSVMIKFMVMLVVYLALVIAAPKEYKFMLYCVPVYALISFGCYSLLRIGINLITIRDCPEAFEELAKQVARINKEQEHPYAYWFTICLLYTSPSPRDATLSRMPSSA